MNNFFLCSVFVRSASVSHRLEASCETHTGAAMFKIIETPASGGADLNFVRHPRPFFMHKLFIISNLLLCLKKDQISDPVRHSANSRLSLPRLSHNPHPTPHNP